VHLQHQGKAIGIVASVGGLVRASTSTIFGILYGWSVTQSHTFPFDIYFPFIIVALLYGIMMIIIVYVIDERVTSRICYDGDNLLDKK
jgi:hypothetical protein